MLSDKGAHINNKIDHVKMIILVYEYLPLRLIDGSNSLYAFSLKDLHSDH